jgi:hypothetical protein
MLESVRQFHSKFPGITIPTFYEVTSAGSLLDKPAKKKKGCVLTEEKLDEIGARLEHTAQKY